VPAAMASARAADSITLGVTVTLLLFLSRKIRRRRFVYCQHLIGGLEPLFRLVVHTLWALWLGYLESFCINNL